MSKTTFTLAEAAELLQVHRETLRRAIKDGVIQAARLGREYRISRTDLETFWASRGGGELFGRSDPASGAAQPPQDEKPEKSAKDKGGKQQKPDDGPRQLTLPTS